jgi:pilus assembly protein CpaE
MYPEGLTISILYGSGARDPGIQEVLEGLPQLRIMDQSVDPQEFCQRLQGPSPDVVLVDLDGRNDLPEWLAQLTQELPQTPILMCSHIREPELLIRAMQVGIREFLPLPLRRDDMEGALQRVWTTRQRQQLQLADANGAGQGRLVVVTGHKGGVGVTTVAVNLALALGEITSERTALVDLGRPFPDVGNFLDQDASYTIYDLVQNLQNLDQSFVQRIMQPYERNLAILHGCSDFKEQDSIELEALEKIFELLRGLYKWVVVDLSHWLDGTFVQVIKEADVLLMLTELTIPDIRNLKKLWPFMGEWEQAHKKVRMVINREYQGDGLQVRDLEQVVQKPVYETLPSDYHTLVKAVNQGTPLAVAAPRSKLYRAVVRLAQKLQDEVRAPGEELAAPLPWHKKLRIFSKG